MTEVIEVTLMYFQIAFVGQSLVWCQAAENMEANAFCFFRLDLLLLLLLHNLAPIQRLR